MVMHTAPVSPVVPSTATEILTVILAEEPPGATADQIARALGLGLDGDTVQGEMEELVVPCGSSTGAGSAVVRSTRATRHPDCAVMELRG